MLNPYFQPPDLYGADDPAEKILGTFQQRMQEIEDSFQAPEIPLRHEVLFEQVARRRKPVDLEAFRTAASQGVTPQSFIKRQKFEQAQAAFPAIADKILRENEEALSKMNDQQFAELEAKIKGMARPEAPMMQDVAPSNIQMLLAGIASLIDPNVGAQASRAFLNQNQRESEVRFANVRTQYGQEQEAYEQNLRLAVDRLESAQQLARQSQNARTSNALRAAEMEVENAFKDYQNTLDAEQAQELERMKQEGRFTLEDLKGAIRLTATEMQGQNRMALQDDRQEFEQPKRDATIRNLDARTETEIQTRPGKVAKLYAENRLKDAQAEATKSLAVLRGAQASATAQKVGTQVAEIKSRIAKNNAMTGKILGDPKARPENVQKEIDATEKLIARANNQKRMAQQALGKLTDPKEREAMQGIIDDMEVQGRRLEVRADALYKKAPWSQQAVVAPRDANPANLGGVIGGQIAKGGIQPYTPKKSTAKATAPQAKPSAPAGNVKPKAGKSIVFDGGVTVTRKQ